MASVYLDELEGNAAELTVNGWILHRRARVANIPAEPPPKYSGLQGSPWKILYASEYLAANTYPPVTIMSPHPARSTARLRRVRFESASMDQVIFDLIYEETPYEVPQITMSANPQTVETNQAEDRDHNYGVMEVSYTFPADYPVSTYQNQTVPTGAMVSVLVPEPVVTITKRTYNTPMATVMNEIAQYVGKTNSTEWNPVPGADPDPVRCWLCTDITAANVDFTGALDVTHTFQRRDPYHDKWDQRVLFIDPNTGRPPSDLVKDEPYPPDDGVMGDKLYRVYEAENFSGIPTLQLGA